MLLYGTQANRTPCTYLALTFNLYTAQPSGPGRFWLNSFSIFVLYGLRYKQILKPCQIHRTLCPEHRISMQHTVVSFFNAKNLKLFTFETFISVSTAIIMPNYFIVKSNEISEWRVKKVWIRKPKRRGYQKIAIDNLQGLKLIKNFYFFIDFLSLWWWPEWRFTLP